MTGPADGTIGDAGGFLSVSRPSGQRPYAVLISLLENRRAMLGLLDEPAAIVFVSNLETRPTLPTDQLRWLFGLTPAEARLTAALVETGSLARAAEEAAVTEGTARQVLKRVFLKTDTHSQLELMKLVLRSPVGLVYPG